MAKKFLLLGLDKFEEETVDEVSHKPLLEVKKQATHDFTAEELAKFLNDEGDIENFYVYPYEDVELRIGLVNNSIAQGLTLEQFVDEAEEEGTVYSLQGLISVINVGDISNVTKGKHAELYYVHLGTGEVTPARKGV